jgi:hypothetical protein
MELARIAAPLLRLAASMIRLSYPAADKALELIESGISLIESESEKGGTPPSTEDGKGVMGSPIPKLSFGEGREYTKKQAIKHIIGAEEHFRSGLCSACLLEKHLPALELYAEEGLSYCKGEECKAYEDLKRVVKEAESILKQGVPDEETQLELAEKFREIRKRLSGYEQTAKEIVEGFGEGVEEGD